MCECGCVFSLWRQTTFSATQLSIHDQLARGLTDKAARTEALIKTHDRTFFLLFNITSCETKGSKKRQKQGSA